MKEPYTAPVIETVPLEPNDIVLTSTPEDGIKVDYSGGTGTTTLEG